MGSPCTFKRGNPALAKLYPLFEGSEALSDLRDSLVEASLGSNERTSHVLISKGTVEDGRGFRRLLPRCKICLISIV